MNNEYYYNITHFMCSLEIESRAHPILYFPLWGNNFLFLLLSALFGESL